MRILTILLNVFAGALFIASLVLAFLGADSVERPATMPLMSASMVCLIAGIAILLAHLFITRAQKR